MTASEKNSYPDFFEENDYDPVSTATGARGTKKNIPKKKAGFYLSIDIIERFDRHFHKLKLAGAPIENKSALLELSLEFVLQDLDKVDQSVIRQAMKRKTN
jgi:hypothetical protein